MASRGRARQRDAQQGVACGQEVPPPDGLRGCFGGFLVTLLIQALPVESQAGGGQTGVPLESFIEGALGILEPVRFEAGRTQPHIQGRKPAFVLLQPDQALQGFLCSLLEQIGHCRRPLRPRPALLAFERAPGQLAGPFALTESQQTPGRRNRGTRFPKVAPRKLFPQRQGQKRPMHVQVHLGQIEMETCGPPPRPPAEMPSPGLRS